MLMKPVIINKLLFKKGIQNLVSCILSCISFHDHLKSTTSTPGNIFVSKINVASGILALVFILFIL